MKLTPTIPSRRRPARLGRAGYSLIEMIVAMAIFAGLVALLSTILVQATRAWRLANTNMQSSQSARVVFDILNRDLQSLYASNNYSCSFNANSLTFWATMPTASGVTNICQIGYTVSGNSIYRRITTYGTYGSSVLGAPASIDICSNVFSVTVGGIARPGFSLSYFLPDGNQMTMNATGYTTTVPARVYINLQVIDPALLKLADQATLTPSATYETSFLIFRGLK